MKSVLLLIVLIALTGLAAPVFAADQPASAVIDAAATSNGAAPALVKNFYAALSDSMKQGDQLGFAGRVKKLTPAITGAFNLPLMTKLAVGPVWSSATPEQQQQLVSGFSDFSIASYASQFAKDDGEQFMVTDEKPTAGGVIVETKLQPKTGDAVALNYLMRQDDKGEWRIVDVLLNGSISQLAARRAEFSGIAHRDGIPALVNTLDEKSKGMGPT